MTPKTIARRLNAEHVTPPRTVRGRRLLGWTWTTLGGIGEYANGRAFKPSEWGVSGKPIIRIQNLTRSTDTVNRFSGSIEQKYLVHDQDFLISWSATLGAFIYRGEEAVLNQHIFKVNTFVDKRFHFYLVNAFIDDLKRQVHGSGMQHITKGKFDGSAVPLPPLPEQRRIVAKIEELFSKLDAGVEALKKVKAELKRYRQSMLKHAFEGCLTEAWRRQRSEIRRQKSGELLPSRVFRTIRNPKSLLNPLLHSSRVSAK